MKTTIKTEKEVNISLLNVSAGVRYWNDSTVNGEDDTEDGNNIPCHDGDSWCPIIDVDSGKILNWKQGTKASIHYKVVDLCGWSLVDESGEVILYTKDGYVPKTLCPKEPGYGDYIIMDIDENGMIANWNFDIEDFQEDD